MDQNKEYLSLQITNIPTLKPRDKNVFFFCVELGVQCVCVCKYIYLYIRTSFLEDSFMSSDTKSFDPFKFDQNNFYLVLHF